MKQIQISKSKSRQSSIELLRIVAMIMIIAHHLSVHSGFDFSSEPLSLNHFWILLLEMGGKIGVNIFILISGYFLITTTSLKIDKVLKLWMQIFTYSFFIFFIFLILGSTPFNLKELITNLLPITFSQWWFASTYFVLYIISPYINRLLLSLSKKEYQRLLALIILFWSFSATLWGQTFLSDNLQWFICLYIISGYLRLHWNNSLVSGAKYLIFAIFIILLNYILTITFNFLGAKISYGSGAPGRLYSMQSLPILLIAISLFLGFINLNIGSRPRINIISAATFGVYLIHDNNYIRPFIWQTLFKSATYSESTKLIPYSLLWIFIIFSVCTVIELCRIYILERSYMKFVNKSASFILHITEKFL
ncbi:surface polysaccharide O-acyltransferase-like enzyme [Lachnospiraceae bacterium PF1-22]|uniref:acyltransferase family protein n=1 Tax=Ohessyouella blattaphilus TaxID=2949333 RepID=UPI003E1CBA57